MKISYSWLQEEYFDGKLPSIDEMADSLLFHSFEIESIEGDIIDVDVLPNRAHDCLSHRGIAKEVSVILGIPIKEKGLEAEYQSVETDLKISKDDLCGRYVGRVLKNVEVKESPDWLKKRLESVGQRSINSLVDATNYVLLDIGQPTHVFDLDKLEKPELQVRKSTGEQFETLDGNKVELNGDDLVVASGDRTLAIAGVKGGKEAEVDEGTKNIVLESAHFSPVSVRKTSRRLDLLTDSAKRFENEPTPELAEEAMEYLTRLIFSISGSEDTKVGYVVDQYTNRQEEFRVTLDVEYLNKILGTNLSGQEVAEILNRFTWDYQKTGDEFIVNIPNERLDLRNEADLAEEIARIYGYKNIALQELPQKKVIPNKSFYYIQKIKNSLIENGFWEVYTPSFKEKGKLRMANPVGEDRPYLRERIDLSLVYDLNLKNKDLLGLDEVKIFEIGTVFDSEAEEKVVLSGRSETKLDENLLEEFGISISGKEFEVELEPIIKNMPEVFSYEDLELGSDQDKKFKEFSKYPFIVRDIAVWLPEEEDKEKLSELIKEKSGDLLVREPRLVDEYAKDGKVSYAYRLVFQSFEKTLTDLEIAEIMEKVEKAVSDNGWEVR